MMERDAFIHHILAHMKPCINRSISWIISRSLATRTKLRIMSNLQLLS